MSKFLSLQKNAFYFLLLMVIPLAQSCSPKIAPFDQFAYTQAISLKVELQNLAGSSSTVAYKDAKADIDNVTTHIQKAYEYSKGRAKDTLSTKQYEILLSEQGFFKSFLNTWKLHGKETPVAANEKKIKLGQLMDAIIELENGKKK